MSTRYSSPSERTSQVPWPSPRAVGDAVDECLEPGVVGRLGGVGAIRRGVLEHGPCRVADLDRVALPLEHDDLVPAADER
jgi:hypothetical protein